jgi:hypothetical protein
MFQMDCSRRLGMNGGDEIDTKMKGSEELRCKRRERGRGSHGRGKGKGRRRETGGGGRVSQERWRRELAVVRRS